MDILARRLAVGRLVLRTQLALMALATVVPELGKAVRLIAEQAGHMLGRGLTGDAPDQFLLVVHLTGIFLLVVILWLWGRGDALTPRFMLVAAAVFLLLAPAGLPIAALLFWMARRPGFDEASQHMPEIAGQRRAMFVVAWVAASIAGTLAAFAAFFLFGWLTVLWFPAMLACALPGAATLWWMMSAGKTPERMVEAAMPRLPDMVADRPYP